MMEAAQNIEQLLKKIWELRRQGNYQEAGSLLKEAQGLCPPDAYSLLGRMAHIKGQFAADHDRLEEALHFSKQSVDSYQKAEKPLLLAHALRHVADREALLGMLDEAEHNYQKCLKIYEEEKDVQLLDHANALRGFALLLEQKKSSQEAVNCWTRVRELYGKVGIEAGVQEAVEHLTSLSD